MDTIDLLKTAMEAVRAADIPKELQATALELAVADLRAGKSVGKSPARESGPPASSDSKRRRIKKAATPRAVPNQSAGGGVLAQIPDQSAFFDAIEKETGVAKADLTDVFHVEHGRLELKVASKSLGTNKRAQTQTVTALLAGAVMAGTPQRKLPFAEISRVCEAKHCFDSPNAAPNIRSTPGFSTLGTGRSQSVATKSGWQDAFAEAVRRVLGKPEAAK